MGCDIHPYVERRVNGAWELIDRNPVALQHRNYNTFAILADVRNGSGFAGIKTGEGFRPIAEQRGLPDDLSPQLQRIANDEQADDENDPAYLGDHSFSWLSLREILEYDYKQQTFERGVLDPKVFLKLERERAWNKNGYEEDMPRPESWSGSISGGGTVIIPADIARARIAEHGLNVEAYSDENAILRLFDDKTYIEDRWGIYYFQTIRAFLVGCVHYVRYGLDDVRIVFGFDS